MTGQSSGQPLHNGLALDTARSLYGRILVGLDPDTLSI